MEHRRINKEDILLGICKESKKDISSSDAKDFFKSFKAFLKKEEKKGKFKITIESFKFETRTYKEKKQYNPFTGEMKILPERTKIVGNLDIEKD